MPRTPNKNLYRWAGAFDRAIAAAKDWDSHTRSRQLKQALRLGEIQYLQGHYTEAAATLAMAARRSEDGYQVTINGSRARLARSAALIAAGRAIEARSLLRDLDRDASIGEAHFRGNSDEDAFAYAVVSYHARLQLGDVERRAGEFISDAAIEDYAAARERLPLKLYSARVVPSVLDNNQALAELALNQIDDAESHAGSALSSDMNSPIFLLTAAAAAQQREDAAAAADLNTSALNSDPTAFPAANNLGVQLAQQGLTVEAATAFRQGRLGPVTITRSAGSTWGCSRATEGRSTYYSRKGRWVERSGLIPAYKTVRASWCSTSTSTKPTSTSL